MPQDRLAAVPTQSLSTERTRALQCILRYDRRYDVSWIGAVGEVDLITAPSLDKSLREAETRSIRVLDLRAVTFMDCAGLRVVVDAGHRADRKTTRLVVVRGPSQLDRLFSASGAASQLELVYVNPFEPPPETALRFPRGALRLAGGDTGLQEQQRVEPRRIRRARTCPDDASSLRYL
jgi:anti-anti-sigma factor